MDNFHVTSATFSHKFTKFSHIRKITQSPACWIQNLPWKIYIEPVLRGNKKYLSIFVGCAAPITSTPWSCRASVRTYKLDGTKPKTIRTTKYLVFDSAASTSWGHDNFILWDTVLNPDNGYIKNDAITVEVSIDAENPVGIKLTSTYFTDERANVAIKLCDEAVSKLESELKQLTDQNAQLRSSSSEEIERLKNLLELSEKRVSDLEKQFNDEHNVNAELKKTLEENKNLLKSETDNNVIIKNKLDESDEKIIKLNEEITDLEKKEEELKMCKIEREDLQRKQSSLEVDCEKYKTDSTNIDPSNENQFKAEIKTLKEKNEEMLKQLSNVQNELKDANENLRHQEKYLQNIKNEKVQLETEVNSITKELSDMKLITEKIQEESNKDLQKNLMKKADYLTRMQALESQFNELLEKLKVADQSKEIENLKAENNKLINQIKMRNEEYNKLRDEKLEQKSKTDHLKRQLLGVNDDSDNLRTKGIDEENEHQECRVKLLKCEAEIGELKKSNEELSTKLREAQSEIVSHVESNEKKLLQESMQQELKKKETEEVISKLNGDKLELEKKLSTVQNDLDNTKVSVVKSLELVNSLSVLEKNLAIMQSKLQTTSNGEPPVKQVIPELIKEKSNLQKCHSLLKEELEKAKTKLNNTRMGSSRIGIIEKKLDEVQNKPDNKNLEISSLNENENLDHSNQTNEKVFGIDLVKGTDDQRVEHIQKLQVEKPFGDPSTTRKHESIEKRLETLKEKFQEDMKEADKALYNERRSLLDKVEGLLSQLTEEKQKHKRSTESRNELEGKLRSLKEEIDSLREVKKKLSQQLKTSQEICMDSFRVILQILGNLKSSGKLPCSVEAFILAHFNTLGKTKFSNSADNTDFFNSIGNQQVLKEISTETLQKKLEQIQTHFEENLEIIRNNCALENNENTNLRMANKELLVAVENEMNMTKLYKEMLKIADTRLGESRKQLTELGNQFLDEKVKRYESEEKIRSLKTSSEGNELLLNDLKEKLLRHSIKLSDIEDTDLPEMFQRGSTSSASAPSSASTNVGSTATKNDINYPNPDEAEFQEPKMSSVKNVEVKHKMQTEDGSDPKIVSLQKPSDSGENVIKALGKDNMETELES